MSDLIEAEKAADLISAEKPKRTMAQINAEYSPLVAQIGERQYRIRESNKLHYAAIDKLQTEIEDLALRIDSLGDEAVEAQKIEAAAKAAEALKPAESGV